MDIAGLVLGILAIVSMIIGLFPCLGWLNSFVVFIAVLAIIFSAIHISTKSKNGAAVAGLVLGIIAAVIGLIRYFLGGGIF